MTPPAVLVAFYVGGHPAAALAALATFAASSVRASLALAIWGNRRAEEALLNKPTFMVAGGSRGCR